MWFYSRCWPMALVLFAAINQSVSARSPIQNSYLGSGIDSLTGEKLESCLASGASKQTYSVNKAEDSVVLLQSQEELIGALRMDYNMKASGLIKIFSGGLSLETSVVRNTNFNSNSLVGMARFRWVRARRELSDSIPALAPAMLELLKSDPEEYRRICGDSFVSSIDEGGELIIPLEATEAANSIHHTTNIKGSLEVGFGKLFGLSGGTDISNEQKSVLQKFSFKSRCYSIGGDPEICAQYNLNTANANPFQPGFASQVNAAKLAMSKSVKLGDYIVEFGRQSHQYKKPRGLGHLEYWQVFYDFRPYTQKIIEWLNIESQVRLACTSNAELKDHCQHAYLDIAFRLKNCGIQDLWHDGECRSPQADRFSKILNSGDLGHVTFYEHIRQNGKRRTQKFQGLYSNKPSIRPGVIYNLHTSTFGRIHDRISSYKINLKPGWRIVLFENVRGGGRSFVIPGKGKVEKKDLPRWFNDKASGFLLQRID